MEQFDRFMSDFKGKKSDSIFAKRKLTGCAIKMKTCTILVLTIQNMIV